MNILSFKPESDEMKTKFTECIFKPEITQDAQKRKDSKLRRLRMLPDSSTLSSAMHVERAKPPQQITYWHIASPPIWP